MSFPPRAALLLLAVVALPRCAPHTTDTRSDNPGIRRVQASETRRVLPDAGTRDSLSRKIGPRVSRIVPGKPGSIRPGEPLVAGGRGAAVSPDGYFLTADHVVGDAPFLLVETKPPARPRAGRAYRADEIRQEVYRGRKVWGDPRLDLALVKFERSTRSWFEELRMPSGRGSLVHTGDNEGAGRLPLRDGRADLGELVGNGPFFAAGRVESIRTRPGEPRKVAIGSSLVARGGMSGAPLVDEHGALCGILTRASTGFWPWSNPSSTAVLVDPAAIQRLIAADRRRPQSLASGTPAHPAVTRTTPAADTGAPPRG